MTLQDLKQRILGDESIEDFIIFKCPDGDFLANQYIDEICDRRGCGVNYINSVLEPSMSAFSLVFDFSNELNVLRVEEFNEFIEDYSSCNNIIVVCEKLIRR